MTVFWSGVMTLLFSLALIGLNFKEIILGLVLNDLFQSDCKFNLTTFSICYVFADAFHPLKWMTKRLRTKLSGALREDEI